MESKYFEVRELVDSQVYNLLGDHAINLLDPRLIETIDAVRDILGVSLICNN